MARRLVEEGHRVTGVDISERQIERARTLVPDATFLVADMTRRIFEPASFDAVIALYSLIHVPLAAQPSVIKQISNCLVDGGLLLATTGWEAWTGSDSDWLGGGVEMWWSQTDQATYIAWLQGAELQVVHGNFVPDARVATPSSGRAADAGCSCPTHPAVRSTPTIPNGATWVSPLGRVHASFRG